MVPAHKVAGAWLVGNAAHLSKTGSKIAVDACLLRTVKLCCGPKHNVAFLFMGWAEDGWGITAEAEVVQLG